MTATAAATSNGTATDGVSVVLPTRVTVEVAGAQVHAIGSPNKAETGIKYDAKARAYLAPDDTRTDEQVLKAIAGLVDFEGTLMPLASHYRDTNGAVVVGASAPKLNKEGEVTRPSAPMVCLWQTTTLGNNGGIEYQVLVKLITGKNSKGRFVTIDIDVTKRPVNEFKPIGEVEGSFTF